jgi:putative transposase
MMTVAKKAVPKELLDSLLADYRKPEDLIGENGLLKQLTKLLVEKALEAEMADHLGHGKNEPVENAAGNTRNGKSRKTLKGDFGELPIEIPRDRHGTFEPQLIPKHQTRWTGFDDKILSLYARGMTVREIQSHLEEMYGTEVSPTLISSVTDAVIEEVKAWQARPLDALYPIVYLDCIHVKVRDGTVRVKAVYLAIGINLAGEKEVLGLWIAQTEGAKFWLQVVTELKNRGVQDIFIACVDGLKGFPEAIEAVYPHAAVQLCIVHMVRNSLNYVSWKMRAEVAADLKRIYTSATADEAEQRWRIRGQVGRRLSADQPVLAPELAAHHSVLRLSAGDPQGDLHDQRHRVGEHELAQDHQESRLVSERRRATQTLLSGRSEHQPEMDDADSGLEGRADSLYYPV